MVHPPVYHAQIEQELIAITKAVLHKDVLKPKQNLFEQGLTSVGVLEIRSRLEKRFQISLQSSTMFDYPTLAALTTCIIERLCSRAAQPPSAAVVTAGSASLSNINTLDDAVVREILRKKFGV